MLKNIGHIGVIIALICLVYFGHAGAELEITGELGVDLESQTYDRVFNTIPDTSFVVDTITNDTDIVIETPQSRSSFINRKISNHFLRLNLRTPIVNDNFATFAGRSTIYGTYYNARSEEDEAGLEKTDDYFSPKLHTYSGDLSLFPNRRYPILLYLSKAFNRAILYESNNRSDTSLVAPGLQINRRYDNELRSRGIQWKYSPKEKINLMVEYKQDKSIISRNYDFNENLNIWVEIRSFTEDPTVNYHIINIINELSDSVDIIIDGIPGAVAGPKDTPDEYVQILIEAGEHNVEFIPRRSQFFNAYRTSVVVKGEQSWKILYNPPATPDDLSQSLTSFMTSLKIEATEKLLNETRFEYTDTDESVQQLTGFLSNFNNLFRYDLSRYNNISMVTTYTKNRTQTGTIVPQVNSSLLHQSTLSLARRKGLSTSISHSINKMNSILPSWSGLRSMPYDTLGSITNIFTARVNFALERFNYEGDFKNSITLLADSLHYGLRPVDTLAFDNDVTDSIPPDTTFEPRITNGYISNQYITDYTSKFKLRLWRLSLDPGHLVKYSKGVQKNPDQNSIEWENRFTLRGELADFGFPDKIKFRGEFGWRTRTTTSELDSVSSTDYKGRYIADISITQNVSSNLKIIFLTNYERETYGSEASTGGKADIVDVARQPQDKYTYRIDIQAAPFNDILFNASYTQILQKTTASIITDTIVTPTDTSLTYGQLSYTPNLIKRYSFSLIATIPFLKIPIKSFFMTESRQLGIIDKDASSGKHVLTDTPQIITTLDTKLLFRFRKMALTLTYSYEYEYLREEKYSNHELRGKISRHFSL